MKKKYIIPAIKVVTKFVMTHILAGSNEGGIIGEAPDMQGEMNCDCGGNPDNCTCGDCCDCWGCHGWESKSRNGFWSD